jgi:hypothetical protein
MKFPIHFSVTVTLLLAATALHGGIKVLVEHNSNDNATARFRFKTVPPPSAADAAPREGRYVESLWKDYTGKTVQELGEEWKALHDKRLGASTKPPPDKGGGKANPPP